MNEIHTVGAPNDFVVPSPPADSAAWPEYVERLLAVPFPADERSEFELYEATPECVQVFLRISECFDDETSYDEYQEPVRERFEAERDELAAALDERWGVRCSYDTSPPDFSVALLGFLDAWPVYGWPRGDRVVLLGVQQTEREHPFELCVAVAQRWIDWPPVEESLWPLFVRQLCDRCTTDPVVVPLWRSRTKPTSPKDRDWLWEGFTEYRDNLHDELLDVWGPPLDSGTDVRRVLDRIGGPSRESVDVWRRDDRFVVIGVGSGQDDSLVVYAAVVPDRTAESPDHG